MVDWSFPHPQERDLLSQPNEPSPTPKSPEDPDQAATLPDDPEHRWLREVYQGDKVPQLTLRAILMGSLIGGVMSLSNLYVGLKTGWALGVAITACILSYAIWTSLHTFFPRFFPTQMSILENNCMQSTASSAGYSTGGTMVSAISAYLLITGAHISWGDPGTVDPLPGCPGRLHGHPHEAADDQRRTVEVPQRHRRGRDPAQPALSRR
jgi:hypothetical protein